MVVSRAEKKSNVIVVMSKNFQSFLVVVVFALSAILTQAQTTGASVAAIPQGMITFAIPHGSISYLSLPLTNNPTYTGSVSAMTSTTISVGDSPAPFTSSLTSAGSPYFVKFLSGNEMGRVLLVTGNTTSSLTLDATDNNSGSSVFLDTTGFNVQTGDIFPGDTLASVFGAGTTQSPLLLTGATNVGMSDVVCLLTKCSMPAATYYFNTNTGTWVQYGSKVNANNTVIYPYSALTIARRANHPDTTLVLGGRVAEVAPQIKVIGNETVFTSTHYAADVALSKLQFGANWVTGTSVGTADTLGVWNPSLNHFESYYQMPDSTWRKYPDATTDQSNTVITAGSLTTIAKRGLVTGASTFIQSPLPYSLD